MHVKLGDRAANEGSRVSKRLHRWRAFHVKRGDVTRLTDAALLLLFRPMVPSLYGCGIIG